MASSLLPPKQMLRLANILGNLTGSQVDTYFQLLDDDRVLRRNASFNIQKRGSILATEAKARGRETLHSLIETLLEDRAKLRLAPDAVQDLTVMEAALRSTSSGSSFASALAAASSAARFDPGPTAQAAVRVAEEQHSWDSEIVPTAAQGAWAPAPFSPDTTAESSPISPTISTPNSVFLVQGRNDKINKAMTEYLTSLGLTVFDWDEVLALTAAEKNQNNPFILDVIEKGMNLAAVVVVLITPDERASLRKETAPGAAAGELVEGFQPRPNVLLEAGMALARDRGRTLLVQWGETRASSDLGGMHVARIAEDTNTRGRLRDRFIGMKKLNIATNQRWQEAGDFTA